jgi:hypothetical protein
LLFAVPFHLFFLSFLLQYSSKERACGRGGLLFSRENINTLSLYSDHKYLLLCFSSSLGRRRVYLASFLGSLESV